jgi:hypothetical protein
MVYTIGCNNLIRIDEKYELNDNEIQKLLDFDRDFCNGKRVYGDIDLNKVENPFEGLPLVSDTKPVDINNLGSYWFTGNCFFLSSRFLEFLQSFSIVPFKSFPVLVKYRNENFQLFLVYFSDLPSNSIDFEKTTFSLIQGLEVFPKEYFTLFKIAEADNDRPKINFNSIEAINKFIKLGQNSNGKIQSYFRLKDLRFKEEKIPFDLFYTGLGDYLFYFSNNLCDSIIEKGYNSKASFGERDLRNI